VEGSKVLQEHVIQPIINNAPGITLAAGTTTFVFWGLHVADIAVLLSAAASVCGVGLQFYVALHRIRRLERQADANVIVTNAMAEQARAMDTKVETKKDAEHD